MRGVSKCSWLASLALKVFLGSYLGSKEWRIRLVCKGGMDILKTSSSGYTALFLRCTFICEDMYKQKNIISRQRKWLLLIDPTIETNGPPFLPFPRFNSRRSPHKN